MFHSGANVVKLSGVLKKLLPFRWFSLGTDNV